MTPPPLRWEKAPVGQAAAQGAGLQARQRRASKPVDNPPVDMMRMPDASHDRRLCTNRAQARAQELQPMQRSIRGVFRIFTGTSFGSDGVRI
jgi:hypothetical protein